MLYYTTFNTPLGRIFVSRSSRGISFITWQETLWNNYCQKNKCHLKRDDRKLGILEDKIKGFFGGKKVDFGERIDFPKSTPLEKRIWKAMRKISYGQTRSYKWLATEVGNKKLARAVGGACSKNPVPIIIPCHRVIRSDGSLGGFSGGTGKKRKLLSIERQR